MRMLDRKLVRDLQSHVGAGAGHRAGDRLGRRHLRAGKSAPTIRSKRPARAYYLRYRFADIFADVRRAPKTIADRIATIPGVAAAEPRITHLALLDVPGFAEPATGRAVSVPDLTEPRLNLLHLREGRLPERDRDR